MQNDHAFDRAQIEDGREYLNCLVFYASALDVVTWEAVRAPAEGVWFRPPDPLRERVILYFHGGGYAYFPDSYAGYLAGIAQYTRISLFALDYPLIPEHSFPAQLESALRAYDWLLAEGIAPAAITLMGDSAGGNLTLTLLLKLRDLGRPLPGSAVPICPWTDVGNSGASLEANERFDWAQKRMAETWAGWYTDGRSPEEPLISPVHADLRGLPPIYIQAGGKEILIDMIRAFHARATDQGVDVKLDVWESMNHNFQAYVDLLEEARSALTQISNFIHSTAD